MSIDRHIKTLTELRETREQISDRTRAAIEAAHADGMSGAQIAAHLGISRQAVNRIYLPKKKGRGGTAAATALVVVIALGVTACGGSSPATTQSPTSVARALVHQYATRGTLSQVICVKRATREYRCEGNFTPTRAAVEASVKGIDTSGFVEADWAALTAQNSGPVVVDVTIGPDGSWVATPVPS